MQEQIGTSSDSGSLSPPQWSGASLRYAREALAISVTDLSALTNIRPSLIELIEADSFDSLPAPAYTRARIAQIARVLRLPEDEVAQSYLHRMTLV